MPVPNFNELMERERDFLKFLETADSFEGKKRSKLKTGKTYHLPFGGVVTRISRSLWEDEVGIHRKAFCCFVDCCIDFAEKKRMSGFSCVNCPFYREG